MPWENRSVEKMREELVQKVLTHQKSKSELCREYHVSRPTCDKWIKRYGAGEELTDQSRCPNTIHRVSEEKEQLIIDYRKMYPALGACKIRRILEDEGHTDLPCVKTINNVFKRNGLITKEASRAATPIQRFEKAEPNEMWQADYKGHFAMEDGNRCHPLNILDDHSRFNICCEPMATEGFAEIKPVMIRLFKEYGLPRIFLCDNGNPWGTAQSTGFSTFEIWLMDLGILTIHGRARHPQTQGKDESFNRSMTKELLKQKVILDMEDARGKFAEYRTFYNEKRPHHALNFDTPSKHYRKSEREYTDKISEWEYPTECEVRKVKSTGYLNWNGQGYFLSEAFGGREIAVRQSKVKDCISLFYRQFRIGRINIESRTFVFKKAYLIENDPRGKDADARCAK